MLKSIEGIYRDGKIELLEPAPQEVGEARVVVTFLPERKLINPSIVEEVELNADRDYWEKRSSKETMAIADGVLGIIKSSSPTADWRYKKAHIGITEDGQVNNFAWCFPLKTRLRLAFRVEQAQEVTRSL